jgi:hypothetical protein
VTLANEHRTNLKGPASGINLGQPADSGISLEQGRDSSEEIEFELTLDAESTPKPSTPKPAPSKPQTESDSSEFELSLDVDAAPKSDSDSEFELTLDDSGGLAPFGEETKAGGPEGEKDIFETDFEVPGLEEESGSEAVAVEEADTDLESSDFELAIGEEDAVAEDESASQVVALDEEEAIDDGAETVTAKSRAKKKAAKGKGKVKAAAVEEEEGAGDFAELEAQADEEEAVAEDEEVLAEEGDGRKVVRQTVVLQQAPWGIFPVVVLFPCVIVMVLLGLMGLELVQTQQGYKPGPLTRSISSMIDGKK